MTWRQGFFRLWVVGSLVWIVYVAATAFGYYNDAKETAVRYGVEGTSFTWADVASGIGFAVIPCLIFLMIGAIIGWIAQGFRQQRN